jgi:hypothetical protein
MPSSPRLKQALTSCIIYFISLFRYLRGYFQKFLTNNCTEETLLFWEYAEDYWRAHPYSQQPFAATSGAFGRAGGASVPAAGEGLSVCFGCDAAHQAVSAIPPHIIGFIGRTCPVLHHPGLPSRTIAGLLMEPATSLVTLGFFIALSYV